MTKWLHGALLALPTTLGTALGISGSAVVAATGPAEALLMEAGAVEVSVSANITEQTEVNSSESVQLAQITSVSELTDVLPSDWAYQALSNLISTYGCIQGYPDRTFRGQSALTRYEFAAGLNACLEVLSAIIAQGGVGDGDLATLQRLVEEFQAELNTLRGRVDALEADVAELEANQFSTTTKLRGQVDFHLGGPFESLDVFDQDQLDLALDTFSTNVAIATGGAYVPTPLDANGVDGGLFNNDFAEDSWTFVSRARLNFDTSFTGEDRLRVRFQASSGNDPLSLFTGYANASGTGGSTLNVRMDDFYYSFPIGNRLDITLAANSFEADDWVTSIIVPYGDGVSDVATPQFYKAGGTGGAGAGFNFALTDNIVLDAGYTVDTGGAANPTVGIFQGSDVDGPSQLYIAQLSYLSDSWLDAGIAYMHTDGSSAWRSGASGGADTFAGMVNFKFGNFEIGGYGAYSTFEELNTFFDGTDNDFNWSAGIALNDLLLEGAQLGVYGGQLPDVSYGRVAYSAADPTLPVVFLEATSDNPWLVEAYYSIPFNEYLTITPSVIYATLDYSDPLSDLDGDDSTLYGVIRATFEF